MPEYRKEIQHLKNLTKIATTLESEAQAHFSRYICVRVSGLVETSVREILGEYTRRRSCVEVTNFVGATLSRFQNPKWDKLSELLDKFSVNWKGQMEQLLEQEVFDSVNSVVTNRHGIAHGQNVGISLAVITNYFSNVEKFVDALSNVVSRPNP